MCTSWVLCTAHDSCSVSRKGGTGEVGGTIPILADAAAAISVPSSVETKIIPCRGLHPPPHTLSADAEPTCKLADTIFSVQCTCSMASNTGI